MRDLFHAENIIRIEPSGSQDMAGVVFPRVNRLDYDANFEDGFFPAHIESNNDLEVARWLEERERIYNHVRPNHSLDNLTPQE